MKCFRKQITSALQYQMATMMLRFMRSVEGEQARLASVIRRQSDFPIPDAPVALAAESNWLSPAGYHSLVYWDLMWPRDTPYIALEHASSATVVWSVQQEKISHLSALVLLSLICLDKCTNKRVNLQQKITWLGGVWAEKYYS